MENNTESGIKGQAGDIEAALAGINAWSKLSPHISLAEQYAGRRNVIPTMLPRLVESRNGTFLVYGGFRRGIKIPASPEQAKRHLQCLMQHLQHLQEVGHG